MDAEIHSSGGVPRKCTTSGNTNEVSANSPSVFIEVDDYICGFIVSTRALSDQIMHENKIFDVESWPRS